MKKVIILPFSLALAFLLLGCNLQAAIIESTEIVVSSPPDIQEMEATATESVTAAVPTAAPISQSLPVASPTVQKKNLVVSTDAQVGSLSCDRASPGIPFDVTIPDDSIMKPEQPFSKTWRLNNSGSCAWDRSYALVWFSGDDFGAAHRQSLSDIAAAGQAIDITVDMVAPSEPGTYWSYWMLQNPQGKLFGIGPNGEAPFWVQIRVVEDSTPTPEPLIVPTEASVVFVQSSVELPIGQSIDLDTGLITLEQEFDLRIQQDQQQVYQFVTSASSRIASFGDTIPTERECQKMDSQNEVLEFLVMPVDTNLCYRTDQGLPGYLRVTAFDEQAGTVSIDLVTWAVP